MNASTYFFYEIFTKSVVTCLICFYSIHIQVATAPFLYSLKWSKMAANIEAEATQPSLASSYAHKKNK